jgi:histidyl-tRNA synthetase
VLELLKELKLQAPEPAPHAYAVIPDIADLPRVMSVLRVLRSAGVSIQMQSSSPNPSSDGAAGVSVMPSFKAQFKRADTSGARYALVFGADELSANSVTVKPMQGGEQVTLSLLDLPALAHALLQI